MSTETKDILNRALELPQLKKLVWLIASFQVWINQMRRWIRCGEKK